MKRRVGMGDKGYEREGKCGEGQNKRKCGKELIKTAGNMGSRVKFCEGVEKNSLCTVCLCVWGEGECGRGVVSKGLVGGVPDTGNGDGEGARNTGR